MSIDIMCYTSSKGMKKLIKRLFGGSKKSENARRVLERKVEQGTDRAIGEYREVFKKLAEYDRR